MKAASADGKLPAAATGLEARYDIKGDGVVTVRRGAELLGTVTIAAIADSAPSIQPLGEPQADLRGTLALTYEVKDDYGVVSAEARLGKPVRNGKPIETRRPPLIPAPPVPLVLPGGDNRDGEGPHDDRSLDASLGRCSRRDDAGRRATNWARKAKASASTSRCRSARSPSRWPRR